MNTIRKNFILCVCSFLVLGGINPRRGMLPIDCGIATLALADQPLVQCYFMLSDLPIKIVAKLFIENSAVGSSANSKSGGNRADNENNSSSDFSLASAGNYGSGSRYAPGAGGGPGNVFDGGQVRLKHRIDDGLVVGVLRHVRGIEIFLLLLMLLLMLPRGGLDDSVRVTGTYFINEPNLGRPNWVFLFGGNR